MHNEVAQNQPPIKQKTQYIAPDPLEIRQFARMVCAQLAPKHTPNHSEVVTGLASFLNFTAQITAKYLSREHKVYLLQGYREKLVKYKEC